MEEKNHIALKIKELRNEKKMSAKDFGKLIGKHHVQVYSYERGTNTPRIEVLQKIIETFNLPSDYFLLSKNNSEVLELKEENAMLRKSKARLEATVEALLEQLGKPVEHLEKLLGNIKREVMPLVLPNITVANC